MITQEIVKRLLTLKNKGRFEDLEDKLSKSKTNFKAELKEFLPKNHQTVLKDFKKYLKMEIERYL